MISNKKLTLLSVVLTGAALVLTVIFMLIQNKVLTENFIGDLKLGDNHTVSFTQDDYYSTYSDVGVAKIELNGESASSKSRNVRIDGGNVTILGGGTYVLSGKLYGSITVDSADDVAVRLVLAGADISSGDGAAIRVLQAKKTVISLVGGTENFICDAEVYTAHSDNEGINAALYSKDDLTFNGTGSLEITANFKDGIKCNDTLKIIGGSIRINAADDGINANDCIALSASTLDIISGGDSIKCENTDTDKGFILLEKSALLIDSSGDGIYSSSVIYAYDVNANIRTGGGAVQIKNTDGFGGREMQGGFDSYSVSDNTASTKGIKAHSGLVCENGTYVLNCLDDALHSNGDITVNGGIFEIATSNDAVHADIMLSLNPESMDITQCLEGLEGGYVTVIGGNFSIISSDDGINATGVGSGGTGGFGGRGGMNVGNPTDPNNIYLTINGGNIYIETGGDGVDSNGGAEINGGRIEVYGPENSGNSSLDFQFGLLINGGSVIAVGSSGMAELPHNSSEQISLVFYLSESYGAGSAFELKDSNENTVILGTSAKKFDWVCVSDKSLVSGESYTLYIDGEAAGTIAADDTVNSLQKGGQRR